jgi:hypothetical protein
MKTKTDLAALKRFLLFCGREGYATLDSNPDAQRKEVDGSTTISLRQDDWRFHDNYFGGEPFGGREVVFFQDQPAWMMVYYGEVADRTADVGPIYKILRQALAAIPDEAPYRGPSKLVDGEYEYQNEWIGELTSFSGQEKILHFGVVVYQAKYSGGLVDL